ncbi:hypothetical protein HKBW3S34_02568, partial [Candidatus Hakubella thermalkaliphila]
RGEVLIVNHFCSGRKLTGVKI